MITRLFSIFDPSSPWIRNWVVLVFFIILPIKIYFSNYTENLLSLILLQLNNEIKFNQNSIRLIFLCVFIFILNLNLIGLFPYVIAAARHARISFSLSLTFWVAIIIFGFAHRVKDLFTHIVPLGCPSRLIFFIVIIESISLIIRPITLAVRLSANIIAGHVILSLIRSISFFGLSRFLIRTVIQIILLILETAVAVVQPYVFFTLLRLYIKEFN